MQESLASFVAKVVSDEAERHDTDDVRGKRYGDDEHGQADVPQGRVALDKVQIEQSKGFQGEQSVQARAGVRNQEFVLPDLQHDSVSPDRVWVR